MAFVFICDMLSGNWRFTVYVLPHLHWYSVLTCRLMSDVMTPSLMVMVFLVMGIPFKKIEQVQVNLITRGIPAILISVWRDIWPELVEKGE